MKPNAYQQATDHTLSLLALSDAELIEAADLTDGEFDELERHLALRAACLGWSGDPMCQPLEIVAAIVRVIIGNRAS